MSFFHSGARGLRTLRLRPVISPALREKDLAFSARSPLSRRPYLTVPDLSRDARFSEASSRAAKARLQRGRREDGEVHALRSRSDLLRSPLLDEWPSALSPHKLRVSVRSSRGPFCLSSPKLAAENKPPSGSVAAVERNSRAPASGTSLRSDTPGETQAQAKKHQGKAATKLLVGTVLLGLGAVGGAIILEKNADLKTRLACKAPEVVKFLETTVFPVLSSSGLAASVPALLAPVPPALPAAYPPPLSPSSSPSSPPQRPDAAPRFASSSGETPAGVAGETVSPAAAEKREASGAEAVETPEETHLSEEKQPLQDLQEKLSTQHEKMQMERLFQLFGRLSENQKGALGLLPLMSEEPKPTDALGHREEANGTPVNPETASAMTAKEPEKTPETSTRSVLGLVSVEETLAAEKEAIRHLSVEELRGRLLDLASQLAIARRYDSLRRAEDVQKLQEEIAVAYAQKLKAEIEKERERAAETLERLILEKGKEIEESANRRLAAELKAQCELRDEREAEERRQEVLSLVELEGRVLGLHAAFDALSLRAQQAQAVNSLMSVVAEIDNALETSTPVLPQLKKLQEMSRLDPVLFTALNSLPAEVTEATREPVPTAGDLRASIKNNMRSCIQAAFVPPDSGIVGHLLARGVSWFYVLEPHPPPIDPENSADPSRAVADAANLASGTTRGAAPSDGEASVRPDASTQGDGIVGLRRNLALLSYAAFYVDRGHLSNALRCLEQLDGLSRAVSREDVQRLRVFLLLQQALQLAKARLACINADLLAGAETAE